ncbi:hypothetical protein ACFPRA_01265 [Sporosarcina soli]|uniref:Uncharacterized protein n=1 Tax=Sporosarcina soli TaxID=334736 RepID=A0ABW0TDT6_9BACL
MPEKDIQMIIEMKEDIANIKTLLNTMAKQTILQRKRYSRPNRLTTD